MLCAYCMLHEFDGSRRMQRTKNADMPPAPHVVHAIEAGCTTSAAQAHGLLTSWAPKSACETCGACHLQVCQAVFEAHQAPLFAARHRVPQAAPLCSWQLRGCLCEY